MKVQEVIDLVNNGEFKSINDVESELPKDVDKVASGLKPYDYLWYVISTSVYQCDDGFVGITGPSCLQPQDIIWPNVLGEACYAEEYEEVQTITYKPKQ